MNVFLEQFYEMPVDKSAVYLKRIIETYDKFDHLKLRKLTVDEASEFKNVNKMSRFGDYEYYSSDVDDCKMIFSLKTSNDFGDNYAEIEYYDKNFSYRKSKKPYRVTYHEIDDEYFVNVYSDENVTTKSYTVLKYRSTDRVVLKEVKVYEPLNAGTEKPAVTVSSIHHVKKIWLNKNLQKHRAHHPAEVVYSPNLSQVLRQYWYQNDKLHRLNFPAEITYDLKKRVKKEAYFQHDKKHCTDAAAESYYNYGEKTVTKIWYENDNLIKTDQTRLDVKNA